jgi:hypothetical protein
MRFSAKFLLTESGRDRVDRPAPRRLGATFIFAQFRELELSFLFLYYRSDMGTRRSWRGDPPFTSQRSRS